MSTGYHTGVRTAGEAGTSLTGGRGTQRFKVTS